MEPLKQAHLLNDYSVSLMKGRKYATAEIALRRAIGLQPNASVLWGNLGVILWNLNRVDEAEVALKKAIRLLEDHEEATVKANPYANYGLLLASMQRFEEAEAMLDKAIEVETTRLNPKWDKACMLLEMGRWKEGLEMYEIREPFKGFTKFPYPKWNGEDLNGKTIYIQAEQGVGDRILFSRYLYWLKDTYPTCHIIFLIDNPGISLLWEFGQLGVVEFFHLKVPYPKADYGCWMMSLPKFHGSTPDNVPKDPGLIKKRIDSLAPHCNLPQPHMKNLKVGVAWTGNPEQDLNHFRTIPFEQILSLAGNPKICLYNLQVQGGTETINTYNAGDLICDLAPELHEQSFIGTGSMMTHLDLVITSCTSVAHLAGAIGVPCWVLLPRNPYWVWLTERTDSIWYDSIKLYRQTVPGKWDDVINNVKEDLSKLTEGITYG